MCDPFTLAAVAVGTAVAGTATSAYGQYEAGKTGKANAKLDAANAENQKQLSNFNADQQIAYGDLNAEQTLALAGLNDKLNTSIADMNVSIAQATTDFNVGIHDANADMMVAQGNAQATIHGINAKLDSENARAAQDQGRIAETASRQQYAQVKSTQRASLAASGVALDEGSALRIQSDTDYMSGVDAATIKTNAINTAFGFRVDAANERAAAFNSQLDGQAKALTERGQALSERLSAEVSIANTKMTSSFQILQTDANAAITASNIKSQAQSDAWNSRVQGIGYGSQAAVARNTAAGINPALMAGGTLLNGASQIAGSWYNYAKAA